MIILLAGCTDPEKDYIYYSEGQGEVFLEDSLGNKYVESVYRLDGWYMENAVVIGKLDFKGDVLVRTAELDIERNVISYRYNVSDVYSYAQKEGFMLPEFTKEDINHIGISKRDEKGLIGVKTLKNTEEIGVFLSEIIGNEMSCPR